MKRQGLKRPRSQRKKLKETRNNFIQPIKETEEISEGMVDRMQSNRKMLIAPRLGPIITLLEKEEARKLNQLMI